VQLIVILSKRSLRKRGIWAIHAMRRVVCDAITARLDRFLIKLHYVPFASVVIPVRILVFISLNADS
jgi:hypothetical protein